MKYIVYAPWEYNPLIGGHVALHKLAKNLCDKGQDVTILEDPGFKCNAKVVKIFKGESLEFDKENTVVIYPEIIGGNPLNAKNVVRWILYDVKPEIEITWNQTDEYFYYSPSFNTIGVMEKKLLSAFEFDYTMTSLEKTETACILFRKNTPAETIKVPEIKQDNFRENVSKFKTFYTYDDATFFSTIAAMCGCLSVIVDPKMSPEEFRKHNPYYGIAYGETESEIEWAKKTAHLIPGWLKKMEQDSLDQTDKFIEYYEL